MTNRINDRGQAGRRVQLHRALSKLGWGSRTQAWAWIQAGEVRVDGQVITDPLTWVHLDQQHITRPVDAQTLRTPLTLALHKPRGIVTTRSDERGRRAVYDLLPSGLPWIFPVGRLDADSEGLLILTNDSSFAMQLTDPIHHVPKTYHVTLAGIATAETLERLRQGVDLSDGRTLPARVTLRRRRPNATVVEMILTEGRNRQLRRMGAAVGHRVRRLVRVAIGAYALGDLPAGSCRQLDESAVELLTKKGSFSGEP